MEIQGRLALVTGASSGIGAATARVLASRGAFVILVGRNHDRLAAVAQTIRTAGGRAEIHEADLADGEVIKRLAARVRDHHGSPDILINNAGAGRWMSIVDTTDQDLAAMLAVPFQAAFSLTREFLPAMRGRGRGAIVNVSSLASFMVWPAAAGYTAARWAMRGFNESLRAEVYGSDISVSLVAFAQVSTGFWEHNPGSWEHLPADARRLRTLSPEEAAAAIAYAIERNKRLVLRPRALYALRLVAGLFPRTTESRMWRRAK